MAFDRITHNILVAEDAGHEISVFMRDGRIYESCFVDRIDDKTITICHRVKTGYRRASIKRSEIIQIVRIEDAA